MAFQEETLVIPLHAEGADVSKRQIADEEVVIHKEAVEEKRSYSGTVMREKVDIEEDLTSRSVTEPTLQDPKARS
jgi:uncharacterized protein (TIGR02271 family)